MMAQCFFPSPSFCFPCAEDPEEQPARSLERFLGVPSARRSRPGVYLASVRPGVPRFRAPDRSGQACSAPRPSGRVSPRGTASADERGRP